MEKVLILLLISLAVAYAAPDPRGLVINLTLYGVYYKCPCERGLTCEVDKTIVGTITNSDFGICHDIGRSKE
ncbi:colipase isoform X2 [Gracilinanus agilis]|uniref:colipase isoform X2 n=1 Tax=Gracilinanus agilis TaxID=191870 RepID=UPI001CFEA806|nr:colipase isoform X2 [Gracilinanus agilis]